MKRSSKRRTALTETLMPKGRSAWLLIFAMCLSLMACGGSPAPGTEAPESTPAASSAAETAPAAPESTPGETVQAVESEAPETETPAAEAPEPVYEEPQRYETDALTWDFDENTGTLAIHGEGPMRQYAAEAPEWDQYKDAVSRVILDEGITSVGAYAFFDYPHLAEVQLPDSVEVIDESAFDFDWELRTIRIPAAIRYIGYRAFYNTLLSEPADLIFPEGLAYIGDYAFHSALKTGGIVSLPATLQYLGRQAFTNALISDIVIAEGNQVYCAADRGVYTKDMKEILMVAACTESAAEFRIPEGTERIAPECFNVIHGIERICIPASVTEIAEGAFFSTFDLKEIVVDEANPNYRSENGLLLTRDGKLLLAWPDGTPESRFEIPAGVERLGAYLLYGRYDGGYTVVLPESVREIGTMSMPAGIAALTLPAGLEKIEDYVFYEGMTVENVTYSGTEADWQQITIGQGNTALDAGAIQMN